MRTVNSARFLLSNHLLAFPMAMKDKFDRTITTLRLSVTDRCDLRCHYCMPLEGIQQVPHEDILTFEELVHVVRVAADLGITRVRLTGGEPLVRKGIVDLVEMLNRIPGLDDLAMTTNGQQLARYAEPLAEAGLQRVNISLDTLEPKAYRALTRGGRVEAVLGGLDSALAAGLEVKLNCVLLKGINEKQVLLLIGLSRTKDVQLRFIEQMPLDGGEGWRRDQVLETQEVLKMLQKVGYTATRLGPEPEGVANLYALSPGNLKLGLISPVSEPFCDSCNRLRLSASGKLYGCLFGSGELDLRTILRDAGDDDELRKVFAMALGLKPEAGPLSKPGTWPQGRSMAMLGG